MTEEEELFSLYKNVDRRIKEEEAARNYQPLDPELWKPWQTSSPPYQRREGWSRKDTLSWYTDRVQLAVRNKLRYWMKLLRWRLALGLESKWAN